MGLSPDQTLKKLKLAMMQSSTERKLPRITSEPALMNRSPLVFKEEHSSETSSLKEDLDLSPDKRELSQVNSASSASSGIFDNILGRNG